MIPLNGPEGENVLKAIESLKGNRDWETVVDWLRKSMGQVFIEQGTYFSDVSRYPFNAGRNAELRQVVSTIEKAKEILQAMRDRKK